MPGLYIHIPFCIKKCAYCDFPSYEGQEGRFEDYIKALLTEAEAYRGLAVDTVFIGGGTPTSIPAKLLEKLLLGLNSCFKIHRDAEFSVEVNPGTVNKEKLSILRDMGVNRLSIGVQSFNDRELKVLGRIHDSAQALKTIDEAQQFFENINIDLMTAIPLQTRQSLMKNLEIAVSFGVEHLSCYSLIIEEGTRFYQLFSTGELTAVSDEEDRIMFQELCSYLKDKGFERYEISNFAKDAKRCRHNLKYWNTEDYLGIGAASHSCMMGKRFYNSADLDEYILSPGTPVEVTELSRQDRIGEYVMMALRTSDGVSFKEFYKRFGEEFKDVFHDKIKKFEKSGLVEISPEGFALTHKGFDVSNSILCEFV